MSRILYVDDDPFWTDIVARALRVHDVDTAASLPEALDRLTQAETHSYDLAIVDLNLSTRDDRLGGEILDALRLRYPATRRVVITGSPPSGSVKFNILERFFVQELILKGRDSLPDLRRVVEGALSSYADALPAEVLELREQLRERLHSRRRERLHEADAWIEAAGLLSNNSNRLHRGGAAERAEHELSRVRDWKKSVEDQYARLSSAIDGSRLIADLNVLSDELESLDARLEREKAAASGR